MKQNWEYKRLGDVCDIICGQDYKSVQDDNGPYPIYGTGGVMGYASQHRCPANSIIIGRKGSINNPLFVEEPFWNVDTAFGVVPNPHFLTSKYFFYFCRNYDFTQHDVAVTIPSLRRIDLVKIQVPVPPLEEQSRIVAELDLLTGIIDKQNAQLKELDNLAQAIFYDMFGDPIENSKGWDIKKLESLCKVITKGTTPTTLGYPFVSNGIGFVKVEAFSNGFIDASKLSYVSEECNQALARSQLQENDLLVCIAGATIGKMALVTKNVLPANTNQACAIVRLISIENLSYIYAFLKQRFAYDVQNMGKGVAQPNLSLGQIRNLDIPLSPLALQQSFAEKIQSIEKQKETIRASIADTQKLLDYTMDKYFG